jgi:membrane-associated phospholipid phosphatase
MSLPEGVMTGALSAGVLVGSLVPSLGSGRSANWQGGILFDDAVRDGLMLRSPADRELAASVSDGLLVGLFVAPVLDAALSAWLANGDAELAGRMLLIDLQAHAIAQGLTALFKHTVLRERPMARGCREDPTRQSEDPVCGGSAQPGIEPASFFSGHTSAAFTSAALVCLHQTELGLLGREGAAAMCATGLALATTVGALRIASDRHYATDVLVGAAVGLLSGWLIPWLIHYNVADEADGADGAQGPSMSVSPMVDGTRFGIQVFGRF